MFKNKIVPIAVLAMAAIAGCKKSAFVELNTNPDVLYSIRPEEQFLNAGIIIHRQDFEQFYDVYRRSMIWMQMSTAQAGNASSTFTEIGLTNQRFSIFYPQLGTVTTDVMKLAEGMSDADKAARQHLVAMAEVLRIYYAFYVSDINGSLAYTEAFQARYGGTFTPKWESQQELFNLWDARLKELATTLSNNASGQIALANFDLYYGGNAMRWAKAANALRMRIAQRLMKRDLAKATTIFRETIANNALLMSSHDDSWVYLAHNSFTAGGNWNPEGFRAPKPSVDYMVSTSDPRLRLFYRRNNYTQANINTAIAANVLAAGTTEPANRFVGAPVSPDLAQSATYRNWFLGRRVNATLTMDTISYLQERMFQPAFGGGDGQSYFPLITWADQLLMRAEMAARGITTENAENLYNQGVTASIQFFNQRGSAAKVTDYAAVTQAEIDAYLNHPTVKYTAAKGVELIVVQQYINFFKQPNEAWSLFKRTGMPNKSTTLALEDILMDGSIHQIPRRAIINPPAPTDLNRANRQASIDEMMKDPDFGTDPLNPYGRVWWDRR